MLAFLDGLILFTGRLGAIGSHRHAAPAIICGLDRPVTTSTATDTVSHATAYIPPGLSHAPDFGDGRAGVLYLQLGSTWALRASAALARKTITSFNDSDWAATISSCAQCGPHELMGVLQQGLERLLPTLPDKACNADARVTAILRGTKPYEGAAGLSRSRLRHLFVAQTEVPFRRHRVQRKLDTAISLAASGLSLTDAAHEAGFSDSAHLSRAFRDMYGIAPSKLLQGYPVIHNLRTDHGPY